MKRIALSLIGMSFAVGLAMQACNGGDDDLTGDGATPDGSQGDAAQGDAAADVVADSKPPSDAAAFQCPSYDGSVPLCLAAIAHCQACGGSGGSSCDTAHFAEECEGYASFYSPQCDDLFVTNATECDASTSCTSEALADASLTNEQMKAANDYCLKCADAGDCIASVVLSAGLELYSNAVNTLIDDQCTPDASTASACKLTSYELCAFSVAGSQLPSDPCADAGGE